MSVFWTLDSNLPAEDNYARIAYNNLVMSSPVLASSEAVGFPAEAAREPNTFEFYKPTALPATWQMINQADAVECLCIGAHNLGSVGASVKAQYSLDGSSWFDASDEAFPDDDSEIMLIFSSRSNAYWRVMFDGGGSMPIIGNIHFGPLLKMQRKIYRDHTPINLKRETVTIPSSSEGGQWLGRNVIRSGLDGSAAWQNLTAAWYRANFDPFAASARCYPFYFAWQPKTFPDEVAFCELVGGVAPSNTPKRDFMSVSIRMKGAAYG